MKRGFLHFIEIIIIILVMFIIILQFTYIPSIPLNFDRTKLILQGHDILFTLEEKGVNWLNRAEIQENISLFLGDNILYDLKIRNAIKTPLFVGCICNDNEFDEIKSILTPFPLNGELINFSVSKLEVPTIQNCGNFEATLPLFYDAIIMLDYNWSGNLGCFGNDPYDYTNALNIYLKNGKGIVQIRDLDASKLRGEVEAPDGVFNNANIYKHFFGIRHNALIQPNQQKIQFTQQPTSRFYPVQKFFHHLPILWEDFEDVPNGEDPVDWVDSNNIWGVSNGLYVQINGDGSTQYQKFTVQNLTFSAEVLSGGGGQYLIWRSDGLPEQNYFLFGTKALNSNSTAEFKSFVEGIPNTIASVSVPSIVEGTFYTYKVVVRGDDFEMYIDDELIFDLTNSSLPDPGFLGFRAEEGITLVDDVRVTIPEPYTFSNFLLVSEEKVELDDNTSAEIILQEEDGLPALVASKEFTVPADFDSPEGDKAFLKGRTAWLSDGATTSEKVALMKALTVWASGEEYHIIPATVPNPATITMFKTINQDMFQPLEIIFSLGFVF